MKKIPIILAATLFAAPTMADEGMWTLFNLPQAVYNTMQQEGFALSYADIYQSPNAVKNAVVNFSGYCSGVVVSPDGLVFTNHHCGFEAIRSHSTVDHDYMLNGFYAKSYEEELPNEDMFVSFMISQKDVTNDVLNTGFYSLTTSEQEKVLDSLQEVYNQQAKRIDTTYYAFLQPFYEGNSFYVTTYQQFNDLRLVFTVPKSMGKFGGETDNWMWPRQTCDFSVFRIYANPKTNGPAAYSKDNVPYHPKHWAQVSLQGYKEGDYAMTMGYPGSTSRYLSSYGIKERRDASNAVRAQARGVRQEVMKRHMDASEAVRIKYDSKYAQSANYWKNSIGMNKCIDSIGLIQTKEAYEQKIARYVDSTGYLRGQLSFDLMKRLYDERFVATHDFMEFRENLSSCFLIKHILDVISENADSEDANEYYINSLDTATFDEATEKDIMVAMLKNYREQLMNKETLPDFYKTIDEKFGGDYEKYVNTVWEKSIFAKNGAKIYFTKDKTWEKDLGGQIGLDLSKYIVSYLGEHSTSSARIDEQERYLCAAKLRMEQDLPHYSDANFTMRLSYGQVGGFLLGGKPSGYYTTSQSIVNKMDRAAQQPDWKAEPIMRQLLSGNDFGPYRDKTTGQMQLCFLTNNDITGGNSGSPMFNGKGELIGLAFDGNWDSLASDINFDHQLARCIGVDIRYVLFMMDHWGHADRLLKEINAK
ncbi:MAG: S46 family peptidase [Prevotella sp.]|jgi:hypothetical protein